MTWGNVREMENWRSSLQLPQYLMAVQPRVSFNSCVLKSPELLGSLHLKELKYVGWTSQPFDMSV